MPYSCMEDTNNPGVEVRMPVFLPLFLIRGQHHDVGMVSRVERVLASSKVVCSVVDAQDLVTIKLVVHKCDCPSFLVAEGSTTLLVQ